MPDRRFTVIVALAAFWAGCLLAAVNGVVAGALGSMVAVLILTET
jgi:hypothetical protein